MKKLLAAALFATLVSPVLARAESTELDPAHRSVGLGFHRSTFPVGGRWWTSNTIGIDFGVDIGADRASALIDSDNNTTPDREIADTLLRFGFEAGMPWTLWRWQGVRANLRPGLGFGFEDDAGSFVDSGKRVKRNTLQGSVEMEVEVFIARNVSLSASHGIELRYSKLSGDALSQWTVETAGTDFAALGFHVYLFGRDVK